jgi:FkbM family methyltransferase
MRFSVVIPTFNHCDDLLKPCIDSILKYTDLDQIELIVSVNGSTDRTMQYLSEVDQVFEYAGVSDNFKVVHSFRPLGFSKATNAGIKQSTAEKIILLNNDTILLDQPKNQWLDILESPFVDPTCGISCITKIHSEPAGRDFAIFFCVAIHRKVFNAIGLLNEEYGVGGGEDTEFCIEAEKAGFKVLEVFEKVWGGTTFTGNFPIYHRAEGTVHDPNCVPDWQKVFAANSYRLALKYNPKWIDDIAKQSLFWLCENGKEAVELYDEVITHNIYQVSCQNLAGRDVIDIGANMGTFSLFASRLGANKVIAVEPVSKTVQIFKSNIERAKITNIVVNQNVASNVSGHIIQIGMQEKTGHNSVYKPTPITEGIKTISLHDLLAMTDSNDLFLKMDCEGGEYDVLLHADLSDMQRITTVAIEIHGDLHPTHKGMALIQNKLLSFGFTLKDRRQIGAWDGIDANGKFINYRDIPFSQELWVRV